MGVRGKTLQIRGRELRRSDDGGFPCTGPVNQWRALALGLGQGASRTRQPGKVIDRNHPERPARGGEERSFRYAPLREWPRQSCARRSGQTRDRNGSDHGDR